ncbi:endonuclease/exonuclease/phosphatase family protein [Micromonospora sp. NPDC050397]|uniref:endonuclease/exonuclease/phosphatase family protein n=1 Tax=Micromonospora sp. NPDC050397 TaxID=3364279 RepID=UPI0038509A45
MTSSPRRSWHRAIRSVAVLAVLLMAAVLGGDAFVRSDRSAVGVDPVAEVHTFCPGAGPGPCAELGGLGGAAYDQVAGSDVSGPPGTPPASVLQLNLCNSGFAGCYPALNKGRAVEEAYSVITELRPQIVTLNEICRDDVANLHPAMAGDFPDDHVFWAFQPAAELVDVSRPYRCRNGDRYGIGILGRVPVARWAGVSVFNGLYPDQGGSPDESRVWLCVAALGNYQACTTHLTFIAGSIALAQCRRLFDVEIPAMRATLGPTAPVVVGGDFNLREGGSPDIRACVPTGYRRIGDGNVQQFVVSDGLPIARTRAYPMRRTDHAGWFVTFGR